MLRMLLQNKANRAISRGESAQKDEYLLTEAIFHGSCPGKGREN